MLTVTIDFKSPASCLALEPTLALARETGVEIDWLPFSVRRFSIPEEQANETVGERPRRCPARYLVALRGGPRPPDALCGNACRQRCRAGGDGRR